MVARSVLASVLLIVFVHAEPAVCDWSLLHPFSSDAASESKPKKVAVKSVKKEPSTWEKLSSGTKKFFNQTGETLGLKKPETKKQYATATPKPRTVQSPKKETSSSWWNPLASAEPKEPKTVSEWIGKKRLDP